VNYFEGSLWFRLGRIYQFGLKNKTQNELIEIYNNSEKSGVFLNKSDESNLHWYKGEVFRSFHDKQYEEAMLIEYDQALIIQPDNYSILCALGNIYLYDLQNYSLALDNFEKAINVNQENALAYYGLGETYLFLDNQSMAIKNYQLAISKDKNFSDAIKKLENLQSNPD
jgi:tetratricopeptide (TPR) repeat protein